MLKKKKINSILYSLATARDCTDIILQMLTQNIMIYYDGRMEKWDVYGNDDGDYERQLIFILYWKDNR